MLRHMLMMFAVCALLTFTGCGTKQSGPKTVNVSGPIALDGEAINEGHIIFRRIDGDLKSFGGRISNGTYQATVEPGKMVVEIVASREVPGKFTTENGTPEPRTEMYIPVKYNRKSELQVEVLENGDHKIPFELKSK